MSLESVATYLTQKGVHVSTDHQILTVNDYGKDEYLFCPLRRPVSGQWVRIKTRHGETTIVDRANFPAGVEDTVELNEVSNFIVLYIIHWIMGLKSVADLTHGFSLDRLVQTFLCAKKFKAAVLEKEVLSMIGRECLNKETKWEFGRPTEESFEMILNDLPQIKWKIAWIDAYLLRNDKDEDLSVRINELMTRNVLASEDFDELNYTDIAHLKALSITRFIQFVPPLTSLDPKVIDSIQIRTYEEDCPPKASKKKERLTMKMMLQVGGSELEAYE